MAAKALESDFHLFVEFGDSLEPRKWLRLLEGGLLNEFQREIRAYGISEYGNSLNFKVRTVQNELALLSKRMKSYFTGCTKVDLYIPPVNSSLTPVPAKVEQFKRKIA